jgi:S-adenosyl methyltransferase
VTPVVTPVAAERRPLLYDCGVPEADALSNFDITRPHIARIYDYWLGGKDNFEVDREAAELALAATPTIVPGVRANRRFLGRAVRAMATEGGVRQFLDIGTGIPASNNTHEVAQEIAPESRVVYVDNDPIVLAHARALLTSATGPTAYIDADARDFRAILDEAGRTLDFSQPVGVMLIAILHCVPDEDDPGKLVADLMAAVPPGSYLAISHPARDQLAVATKAEESLTKSMGQKVTFRTHDEVAAFFAGLELLPPGVVPVQSWRPTLELDSNSAPTAMWGGVGYKG